MHVHIIFKFCLILQWQICLSVSFVKQRATFKFGGFKHIHYYRLAHINHRETCRVWHRGTACLDEPNWCLVVALLWWSYDWHMTLQALCSYNRSFRSALCTRTKTDFVALSSDLQLYILGKEEAQNCQMITTWWWDGSDGAIGLVNPNVYTRSFTPTTV